MDFHNAKAVFCEVKKLKIFVLQSFYFLTLVFSITVMCDTSFAADEKPQQIEVLWSKSLGETDIPRDQIDGISIDPDHNTVISGVFVNELVFEGHRFQSFGEGDLFVASLDLKGKLNWIRQFGSTGDDNTFDLSTDGAGNIYLSGWFSNTLEMDDVTLEARGDVDQFLAKLNKNGKVLWARSFGGPEGDGGNEISVLENGEIAVSGITAGDYFIDNKHYKYGGGRRDAYVLRFDTDGNLRWAHPVSGPGMERIRAISLGADGSVYVGFQYLGSVTIDNQELKSRGDWDGALAKFSASGRLEWLLPVAAEGEANVSGVVVDEHGDVYASGIYRGDGLIIDKEYSAFGPKGAHYLAKVSPDGQTEWIVTLSSKRVAEGVEIAADDQGPIISGFLFGDISIRLGQETISNMATPGKGPSSYVMAFDRQGQPRFHYMAEPVGRKSGVLGGTLGLSRDYKYLAQSMVFQNRVNIGETQIYSLDHRDAAMAVYKIK